LRFQSLVSKRLLMLPTEKELNDAILKITMAIQADYPELSKYLSEMPITIPSNPNPDIKVKNLSDYYESLQQLVSKYAETHS
jgi:hypothetical protein